MVTAVAAVLAACGSSYEGDAFAAFIACLFYGSDYGGATCYVDDEPLGTIAPSATAAPGRRLPESLHEIRSALHTDFIAYQEIRASAAATGRAAPSPAEFVAGRHPDWGTRLGAVRSQFERELGAAWIHRIAPPQARRRLNPTEPL